MSHPSDSSPSHNLPSSAPFSPPNDPGDHQPPHQTGRPQSHPPVSPRTSASPSHFDASGASSPHQTDSVITPATAPLMSTDPSQQGYSPAADSPRLRPAEDEAKSSIHDRDALSAESSSIHRSSSKHRLAEDESESQPSKRRRTDHDRHEVDSAEIVETKLEDEGAVATESNSGPFFKVSSDSVPISCPHPSLNVLSLYGLDDLSASVARKDPKTGEKINKLRKSYEGKIKDLPGKNKAVPKERELSNLLNYPSEEWDIHHVHGKEISSALSPDGQSLSEDFMSSLRSALDMTAGPLPQREDEHWRSIIDLESPGAKLAGGAVGQALGKADKDRGTVSNAPTPATEPPRPHRRGTKRSYKDDSFEGYDELGDELDDNMVLDDDDRRSTTSSTAKKKRRRDTGSASHFSAGSLPQFSPSTTVSVGGNGTR